MLIWRPILRHDARIAPDIFDELWGPLSCVERAGDISSNRENLVKKFSFPYEDLSIQI